MGADLKDFINKKSQERKHTLKKMNFLFQMPKAVMSKIGSERIIKTGKRIGKEDKEQLKNRHLRFGTEINKYLGYAKGLIGYIITTRKCPIRIISNKK